MIVSATGLVFSAHFNDFVDCGPVDTACECEPDATVCTFQLYVEHAFTFTKYNTSRPYAQGQGELFHIDENGAFSFTRERGICQDRNFVKRDGLYCDEESGVCLKKSQLCTEPITVDGRSFKTVLAVNKQFPGPTLIVREDQIIAVDVHNNLSTEGISIHWHGQHQFRTNFMDGVGLLTQCPILPGSSLRYIFKAGPSGTFWYHSHMGSQRANGLFGALIVREKENINYPISFIDDPASHTVTVMDWFLESFEDFFRSQRFGIGAYPHLQIYELPPGPTPIYYHSVSPDITEIGNFPFWSALIHGRGRHCSVPYERSSLTTYKVEKDQTYRFRLIHTGVAYALRYSIDGHKLTVMATDGYVVQPLEVDYIGIHSGERYDFLLTADQEEGNFWMKAETFEADRFNSPGVPYIFHDHKAEGILHYSGSEEVGPLQYNSIPSPTRNCTGENPCKMLNCPFGEFHPSYNITCISIDKLRLFSPTTPQEMPDQTPDVTYFMNLAGFVGREKPISSINDKHFRIPKFPLATQYERNDEASFCDVNSECERSGGCECTTVIDLPDNVTVRFVISTVGEERNATHPIHIHGHSVHVLKNGYGEYSSENGSLLSSSRDLTCTEDGNDADVLDTIRCPSPRFRSTANTTFSLDTRTVRKDTFIVPQGGYVVVQFRSDNPGYWLFHCHVELHQREGMALVIREAVDKINPPPREMETCEPFIWDAHEFMESLEGGHGITFAPSIFVLSMSMVAIPAALI